MSKKIKTLFLCLGVVALLTAVSANVWGLSLQSALTQGNNILDIDWYDVNGTEFTIETAEQFREFAELSDYYTFEGQTIKLGADITDNEGTATDWENVIPEHLWKPIGNFAGTFDGQGHTISGICGYGFVYTARDAGDIICEPTGLFRHTKADCVIKNFRLVNSFFYSDFNEGVGSISSDGGGTFDSIYSNATVLTYKENAGGIVGILDASGENTVTDCWFDGVLRIEGNFGRYAGGIVGRIMDTGGQNQIEHCLNTGTLSSTVTGRGINLAGIVGNVSPQGRVTMEDCLNTGSVSNEYGVAVGSVIGLVQTNASVTITNVYTTLDSYDKAIGIVQGKVYGSPTEYDRTILTGSSACEWTQLNFDRYWTAVEDGTPALTYFTEAKAEEPITPDTSWISASQGTQEDPYRIADAADLCGLASLAAEDNFAGKYIRLDADITLNSGRASNWSKTAPANSWTPIGTQTRPFAGTFDGQNHTISGMYLNTTSRWVGLFSATANGSEVCNLKLKNSYIKTTAADVGSIAGIGRGTFDTVYSNAIIDCLGERSGGMIGQAAGTDTVMTNCWFDGIFTTSGAGKQAVGGLAGIILNDAKLTVTSCHVSGTVDATACGTTQPYAGGLVGRVGQGTGGELVMSDSLVTGLLKTNTGVTAGFGAGVGMVSANATSTISKVYFTAESSTRSIAVATGSTYTGTPAKVTGSILGAAAKTNMPNLAWDTAWFTVQNDIPMLLAFSDELPTDPTTPDVSWLTAYQGTQADPYLIADMGDLYGLAAKAAENDFANKYFRLTADIILNGGRASNWRNTAPANSWTPIGTQTRPFAGIFDGQNHTISGMYLNTTSRWVGLFSATANGSEVCNLKLKNSYIKTTAADVGSIAGIGRGTFDKVYSDAIIDCEGARSGGILGQASGTDTVTTNCWFAGSITNSGEGMQGTGGLAGIVIDGAKLTVTGCFTSGTVDVTACGTTKQPFAGGLVGQVGQGSSGELVVSDSLVTGFLKTNTAITAGYGAGVGMVSKNASSTITRHASVCYLPETSNRSISVATGGTYTEVPIQIKGSIVGANAYVNMPGLDYDTWWFAENGKTPIPKAYATQTALKNEAAGKFTAVSDAGVETSVKTFAEACSGAAYVKLVTNTPITLTADTVVDVNNRTVTVNNDGFMLNILDRNADNFGEAKSKVTVTDAENLNVVAAKPGAADQYVALKNEDGTYTPHWLYVKLTTATLRTAADSVGIYYKSAIKTDEVLKDHIIAYGIAASLSPIPTDFQNDSGVRYTWQEFAAEDENVDITANSCLVEKILEKGRTTPSLDECGRMPVYAVAYITAEIDGEAYTIQSTVTVGKSLYQLVNTLNSMYTPGTAPDMIKQFVANWSDPMKDWNLTNLGE